MASRWGIGGLEITVTLPRIAAFATSAASARTGAVAYDRTAPGRHADTHGDAPRGRARGA
jgi:hypothetical protein